MRNAPLLELPNDLFRDAKRESHSCPTRAGHDLYTWLRRMHKGDLFRVLCINSMPALSDPEHWYSAKRIQVVKNEIIDLRLVENVHKVAIFLRIPDDQLAISILSDHYMDSQTVIFRHFVRNSCAISRK